MITGAAVAATVLAEVLGLIRRGVRGDVRNGDEKAGRSAWGGPTTLPLLPLLCGSERELALSSTQSNPPAAAAAGGGNAAATDQGGHDTSSSASASVAASRDAAAAAAAIVLCRAGDDGGAAVEEGAEWSRGAVAVEEAAWTCGCGADAARSLRPEKHGAISAGGGRELRWQWGNKSRPPAASMMSSISCRTITHGVGGVR